MNVGAGRGKLICGMGEREPGLPRMKPGENPPGKSGLLRERKNGLAAVGDDAGVDPAGAFVLGGSIELMRLDERRQHKTVRRKAYFEFREGFGNDLAAAVGEDRLGKNIVEGDTEAGGGKVRMIEEGRTLQLQHRLSDLLVDAGVNQPAIGLEAVITLWKEVRDEEPASTERSAAEIEERIVLAQSKGREQPELGRAHEVILLGRPDKSSVVIHPRSDLFRGLAV